MGNFVSGLMHGFRELSTAAKVAAVATPVIGGGVLAAALVKREHDDSRFADRSYLRDLGKAYGGASQAQQAYDEVRKAIPGIEERDPGPVVLMGPSNVSAAIQLTEHALASGQSGTEVAHKYLKLDALIPGAQSVNALGMFLGNETNQRTHEAPAPEEVAKTYERVRSALPGRPSDEDLTLATYAMLYRNASFEDAVANPAQALFDAFDPEAK